MGDEEAPVRTERAWFLSAGEESEVRTGADFLAGEISVLTIPLPHPYHENKDAYCILKEFDRVLFNM
jgi:hypothetical protein